MDVNIKNDAFTLVGIKSINPEITGCETMDLNLEIPIGETSAKVVLKVSSTVAGSVVAQERLNQIGRDNIDFLGAENSKGIQQPG